MSARAGRRAWRVAASTLLPMALLCLEPWTAVATPPPPILQVHPGEAWRATNRFQVTWSRPDVPLDTWSAHYRVLRPDGSVLDGPVRLPNNPVTIQQIVLPVPGEHTVEVSFEDTFGTIGPSSRASLRFDDRRPGTAGVEPLPQWIGASGLPRTIQVQPPGDLVPVSGIGGYAISVDGSPAGSPCADPLRCTDAETDLRGDETAFRLDELREGISYLHVHAVSGAGLHSETPAHAILRVDRTDPLTELHGAGPGWSNRPVHLMARATDDLAGMERLGEAVVQPYTAIRVAGETPKIAMGGTVEASLFADGVHIVEHYARDAAGNVNDGAWSNGHRNNPPATDVIRIDRDPPSVRFASAQDASDPERIEAIVSDELSGPGSDGWIGLRLSGSGDPFEPLPTSVEPNGLLRARWSSDDYPPGAYEFRATGYDRAGNVAGATERIGGTSMLLGNPLKMATTLRADLVAKRRRSGLRSSKRTRRRGAQSIPYGQSPVLRGSLQTAAATPMAGLPVEVVERFPTGQNPAERVTTVRADSLGRFSVRLPAGPSREVLARFRGSPVFSRSASAPFRLRVRSGIALRASSATAAVGGRPLVFRGRVRAGRGQIPPEGKAVSLQFRLPGMPWTEFRSVRTDRRGHFRLAYRFADDDSRGVSFLFRAYATPEAGWPYEPGSSRPVPVRGK